MDTNNNKLNNCICLRDALIIQCTGCGFMTRGRIAKICKIHPKVMFLMDYSNCPFCNTPAELMQEYESTREGH